MKKCIFALALVAGAGICATADAALVAYWNFNGSTTANGTTNTGGNGTLNTTAPDAGAATMSFSSGLVFNTTTVTTPNGHIGSFGGSLINAIGADPSGGALDITGAADNKSASAVTANGQFIQFQMSMTGRTNLVLTWAGRGTGTGFGNGVTPNKIQYSTDGGSTYQQLMTYTSTQTTFQLYTANFGGALDGLANAFVRIVIDGASGGAGNNRWDNIQFNADVPAPGSVALIGLAGLVAGRRRRN